MKLYKNYSDYVNENMNIKHDVIILTTINDKKEGMYIDGILNCEGNPIGEDDRLFLLKKAEELNFRSYEIRIIELSKDDDNTIKDTGFPMNINKLEGNYRVI